jgi:hypothetical protein
MAVRKTIDPDEAYTRFANKLEAGLDRTGEVVSLVEFFEGKEWAGMRLRPRQRLLSKVIDNAVNFRPLETDMAVIRLDEQHAPKGYNADKFEAVMPHCTCRDADGYVLYDELADYEHMKARKNEYARIYENLDPDSDDPVTIVLIIGRGGGKTTWSAGVAGHQAHRVLSHDDPHGLFDLEKLKPLAIQNVATAKKQANEFFQAFISLIRRIKWFDGRYRPPTADLVEFSDDLAAEKSSSNSKSGRGRDTVVYIHDEIAFSDKTDGPRSDKALFDAIYSAVKTRAKGKGIVLVFSSPAEADGVLYELYSQAERGLLENSIVVQIASWEIIPGETKDTYKAQYRRDEDVADAEFGAQFYRGAKNLLPFVRDKFASMEGHYRAIAGSSFPLAFNWVEAIDEDTLAHWGRKLKVERKGYESAEQYRVKVAEALFKWWRKFPRTIHIDTSEGSDRTALVMCHVRGGRVCVDLVRAWDREVGYTLELVPFVKMLASYLDVQQVSFDQFASIQAKQDLEEAGLNVIKMQFTAQTNDAIARNIRQVVLEDRLAMYPIPEELRDRIPRLLDSGEPWDEDSTLWPYVSAYILREEMAVAKKTMKGRLIAAEAPTAGMTQTDDTLDALMACVYQAIDLAGGAANFFTIPRTAAGLGEDDELPENRRPGRELVEVECPHHGGRVLVDPTDRIVACPECGHGIQTRM